jgi:hypothetical protein
MQLKLAKPFSPKADLKKVCEDPEANPAAIADALDQASHNEWRDWLPETLRSFIGLTEDQVLQLDKVMAVQVVLTNSDLFEDWTLFHHVAVVFNHRRADFHWVEPLSSLEMAWACVCIHRLDQNRHTLHPDLQKYVGMVAMTDGLLIFPWSNPVVELPGNKLFEGLVTDDEITIREVKKLLAGGMLEKAKMSDVDESDEVEAQAAKLLATQTYINAQKSDDPGEYVA